MPGKNVAVPLLAIAFVPLASIVPCPVAAQSASAENFASEISVGQTATASHRSGEPFRYRFRVSEGHNYLVTIRQLGLDLVVTIRDPQGRALSYDSPVRRDGLEWVLIENSADGEYVVTVESRDTTDAIGGHELQLEQLDTMAEDSRRYAEALSLLTRAANEYAKGEAADVDRVISDHQHAGQIWRDLDRQPELAQTLYAIAMLEYWNTYEWAGCAAHAAEAARIYAGLGEQSLRGNALFLQGAALIEEANELESTAARAVFDSGMELLREAREIHAGLGHLYDAAQAENTLGLAHLYRGEWDQARESWITAADAFGRLGEWLEALRARQNIAVVDGMRGYNGRAIDTLQSVVNTLPGDSSPELRANVLDNLAENHRLYGNFDDALRLFNTALDIHIKMNDAIGEAYSRRGIGNTYFSLGKLELASGYLEEALAGAVAASDGRSQESILARLGDIAFIQGKFELALGFHQDALTIASDGPDRAHRQLAVSRDLASLGRIEEALALATESSAIAEAAKAAGTYADAELRIGRVQLAAGRAGEARGNFERALAVYEELGLSAGQADAYDGLAASAAMTGRLDDAIEYGYRSLAQVESVRGKVAAPELRAEYAAANRRYFESQIDRLMARQRQVVAGDTWLRDALEASERSRARMMTDLLREVSARSPTRTESNVIARQRALYEELAAKRFQRDRLLTRGSLDETARSALASLTGSMTELENELNVIATEMRSSETGAARYSADDAVTVAEMQDMLDAGSVMLHYVLGDERSFVWTITSESVSAAELPGRQTVEATARLVLDGLKRFDSRQSALRELETSLAQLSNQVVEPIAAELHGRRRLLLALDGALQYIPFGALSVTVDGGSRRLVESHEIINVPSLTMIAALRARSVPRGPKTIAIFADPVVSADDPRLARARVGQGQAASASDGAFEEIFPDVRLGRLPSTAREAEVIRTSVPADSRFVAEGFDATLGAVNSAKLGDYRFLHFATHGVVDTRYPLLSAIVLSRFSPQGLAQPGLLRLYDVFGLELNADLVVLSACETALGREIRGEGMLGLAQGFMYAGADGVLVSLWQVPDRATAELMSRFYEAMLVEGRSAAQALGDAQRLLAADRRWRHPYFWAPFVLAGDWR